MLDCPSIQHPPQSPAGEWDHDYTYNKTFGYNNSALGAPPSMSSGCEWIKKDKIRRETLVSLDTRDNTQSHDYTFSNAYDNLVPPNPADYKGVAGTPHQNGKLANMLFVDGQVILDDPNKMKDATYNWIVAFRKDRTSSFPY
jgi:prepilin-type processing-associated H-X9-DG protein